MTIPPNLSPDARIALIEDDDAARFLYSEVLRGAGYAVTEFSIAKELRDHGWVAFDLLIADLILRDKHGRMTESGINLIRDVAASGLRCVAISASRDLLGQAFDAGAILPLPKPITNDVLVDGVKLALRMWWM